MKQNRGPRSAKSARRSTWESGWRRQTATSKSLCAMVTGGLHDQYTMAMTSILSTTRPTRCAISIHNLSLRRVLFVRSLSGCGLTAGLRRTRCSRSAAATSPSSTGFWRRKKATGRDCGRNLSDRGSRTRLHRPRRVRRRVAARRCPPPRNHPTTLVRGDWTQAGHHDSLKGP